MMELAYLQKTPPKQTALLKAECADFVVKEQLGYDMSGDGEFVAVKIRKTDCNTLFVGEQLAKFAGISARNMSYAGLKDRKAVTEQWFTLQMPGQPTPDFSQFHLEGVDILEVTRHQRKIRIGSRQGNHFEILLRHAEETDELKVRLDFLAKNGFPNYFTEQRFGRDGNNLTQALRWAAGEIKVKDRNKRSFYLSAARSKIFNLIVAKRIELNLAQQVLNGDVLQLNGSHSWFVADASENLAQLQQRLAQQDILLTAPLIGEEEKSAVDFENEIFAAHQALFHLMRQERVKTARRPILMQVQQFQWQFEPNGLRLKFYLPAGSYATALVRELVNVEN
ncbi:tRNA pseudouridine(13) synthase TruD [Aggregatibacter actinomycetemcomitans]|uniref:tRNA pseudouridine(13) synthase TruD n=1 Tax=Aggregatibacter actinomycetemcomitans TaxID=714 RepID=UPI0011D967D8|nr:tRNA pseudouridine(13) synthase TruD [Aggregatibacter actinomycetemcomitans]QEH47144.1 tRNA pseudouridine(13) synthase TruD [Aggregatibacter actinomycetemcomitans]TYA48919.1 tRNA pseudouridine(13) synthase TruD [Aggregatibacter actinomycetemcomitans]